MKSPTIIFYLITISILSSCSQKEHQFDATGTFEADDIIISSEASGKLVSFDAAEGKTLSENQFLGYVDTTQLFLSKAQLNGQIHAIHSKKPNIDAQLNSLNQQLKAANIEKLRIENLFNAQAATSKQLDDIIAQIEVINGNIIGLESTLKNNTKSLEKEILPIKFQILQVEDKIDKSKIINPIKGTVLSVYVSPHELVGIGQPLYRIADISNLSLKAYITGDQFSKVKLNQAVTIFTDNGEGGFNQSEGTIYWISDKAEFTPKSVQTKNERANKVYAIKVRVKNNGAYKIGMYAELTFNS